jgi:hypothetical protein
MVIQGNLLASLIGIAEAAVGAAPLAELGSQGNQAINRV